MSDNLKEQIFQLIKLQKNETEKLKKQHLLDSMPPKIDALDDKLSEYEQNVADQDLNQSELKKKYRDNETEVQLNADRIERSQAKLPSVKTNREYQALLKEIDNIKSLNSRIEDSMLADLERIEENEKQITLAKKEYQREQEKIKSEKELIQTKVDEIQAELIQCKAEWEQIVQMIDPETIERFNRVKTMIPDTNVIVSVTEGVCDGCHMTIMPQTYNELQRSEKLMLCPHCQRMIYHESMAS